MDSATRYQSSEDRMQGITSGAAVDAVGNRYDLILIASRRARELSRGDQPKVFTRRGPIVAAMQEIEAGKIGRSYLYKEQDIDPPRQRRR